MTTPPLVHTLQAVWQTSCMRACRGLEKKKGAHAPAVDWWSFGCVVYEMLSGSLPFGDSADLTKYEIYTNITEKKLRFGKGFGSRSGRGLLRRLLDKNPETRLGWEGVQVLLCHCCSV